MKTQLLGGCLLCCFFLLPLIFCAILIQQSALSYFISGEIDSRTWTRVFPGGYIILQYQLIFLQYWHIFSLHFLNRVNSLFHHIIMCCISEDNFTSWFLNNLSSEDNHSVLILSLLVYNLVSFYSLIIASRSYVNKLAPVDQSFVFKCRTVLDLIILWLS